jgi:hypothetical protein
MAFMGFLTACAVVYSILAFRLDFLGRGGTLGPGFFPRIIGVLLVALLAVEVGVRWICSRRGRAPARPAVEGGAHLGDAFWVGIAAIGFAVVLPWAGAFLSMALFLAAGLAVLNPGRWAVNLAVVLVVPAALHLLFGIWLGVPLPAGVLGRFG